MRFLGPIAFVGASASAGMYAQRTAQEVPAHKHGVIMFVIAVTGGIGSGKSTATSHMRSKGALVLDLDQIAHTLLEPGQPPFERIVEAFGRGVLDATGHVDRAALANAAFGSKATCSKLNSIMHPAVADEVLRYLSELRTSADPPSVVVMEVPLLVEAPSFARAADVVLAVAADAELRVERCVLFGRAEQDARARLACQATDAEREALADWTIVNEGSLDGFVAEVDRFWHEVVEPRAT